MVQTSITLLYTKWYKLDGLGCSYYHCFLEHYLSPMSRFPGPQSSLGLSTLSPDPEQPKFWVVYLLQWSGMGNTGPLIRSSDVFLGVGMGAYLPLPVPTPQTGPLMMGQGLLAGLEPIGRSGTKPFLPSENP